MTSWGEHILPAGEYDVLFLEAKPMPLVIVLGMGIVAMIAPVQVEACERSQVNTLLFGPSAQPPQVQLLRLATLEIDLRFLDDTSLGALPGVLALPLRSNTHAFRAVS
ncbi:MAG: hypothetical protein ACRD1I_04670 [Terriglobia bacterium]